MEDQNRPNSPVLWMAPFRGITHKAWRIAMEQHIGGPDVYYAPFISGTGPAKIHRDSLKDLLPKNALNSPLVPQVLSTSAEEIILLGNTLEAYGFTELNWNLGCPFARIANKKRGCGILPYPGLLDQILDKVFDQIRIKLSIKTRLGYHDPQEIAGVLEVFNKYPIQHIILHPRTGKQGYKGMADPRAYKTCLGLTRHKLIYNGDLYHRSQHQKLQSLLPGQTTWMIGRGALINPFLASELKGIAVSDRDKRSRLEAFHDALWQEASRLQKHETRALGSMKAIWHYLSGIFANGKEVFTTIKRAKNRSAYFHATAVAMQQDFADERQTEDYFKQLTT